MEIQDQAIEISNNNSAMSFFRFVENLAGTFFGVDINFRRLSNQKLSFRNNVLLFWILTNSICFPYLKLAFESSYVRVSIFEDFFRINDEVMVKHFWLALFYPISAWFLIPVSVGMYRVGLEIVMKMFALDIVNKPVLKNLLEHFATIGMVCPFVSFWLPSPSKLFSNSEIFAILFYLILFTVAIWTTLLQAKAVKIAYNLKSVGLGLLAVIATKLIFSLAIGIVVTVFVLLNGNR